MQPQDTPSASGTPTPGPRRGRILGLIAVFIAFNAYSWKVTLQDGYWGFLDVPAQGGWGLQVFLDLCIALCFVAAHMRHIAKVSGVNAWPYIASIPFLGSIGPLAFYIHAELRRGRAGSA